MIHCNRHFTRMDFYAKHESKCENIDDDADFHPSFITSSMYNSFEESAINNNIDSNESLYEWNVMGRCNISYA